MDSKMVATYRLAYLNDTIDLCDHHATSAVRVALGEVKRGAHRGTCDLCAHAASACRGARLPDVGPKREV